MLSARGRAARCLAAVGLLFGLLPPAGCSLVFVRGAPSGYEPSQGPPRCVRRGGLPPADLTGAVVGGLAALAIAWAKEPLWTDCGFEDSCPEVDHTTSKALGLASLGLLVSSMYGSLQGSDCADAHSRYRAYAFPPRRVPVATPAPPRPAPRVVPVKQPAPAPPLRLDCRPWRAQVRAAATPEERLEILEMTPPACRPVH